MRQTINEFLENLCQQNAHKTALYIKRLFKIERYTYVQLWELCQKTAIYLQQQNILPGDKILIWGPNMPEWVIVFLGSMVQGVVVVPINHHATQDTVEKYIDQTHPKLLFISKSMPQLALPVPTQTLEDLPKILANILSTRSKHKPEPQDLAEIVFTSGSTGNPKGAQINHKNLIAEVQKLLIVAPPTKEYKFLSILPLSHVMEQVIGLFVPLALGGTIYYLPNINPATILRALQNYGITHITAVPQFLRILLDNIEYKLYKTHRIKQYKIAKLVAQAFPLRLRRLIFFKIHHYLGGKLQLITCGSAHLSKKLAKDWETLGLTVIDGYGATETTGPVTVNTCISRNPGSVGKALPEVNINIAQDGEILVKSPTVFAGYYENGHLDTFTEDGYLKTGDIGKFDQDGCLYITGRKKFKIVTQAGDKIYPEDLEQKLNENPLVIDSCVVGIAKQEEEVPFAVIITKYPDKLRQIIDETNKNLAPHQKIYNYRVWPEIDFPRFVNLKIDRQQVKNFLEKDKRHFSLPKIHILKDKLKEIIAKVCNVEVRAIRNNDVLIRDLGLDSLRRVALVSLIEEAFGKVVEEIQIDQKTTVEDLKQLVESTQKTPKLPNFPKWPLLPAVVELREWIRTKIIVPVQDKYITNLELIGQEHLENITGPVILVFNHVGHYDSGIILRILPPQLRKKVVGVGDIKVFHKPLGYFVLYFLGNAFPINKWGGSVRESLDLFTDLLDKGWSLLISPEGAISENGSLQKLKTGAAMLSIEANVPIIPFKILGYKNIFTRFKEYPHLPPDGKGPVTVKIGKPLKFDEGMDYQKATQELQSILTNL